MSRSSTTGATYPSAYASLSPSCPTSPRGITVILSTGDAPSVSSDTSACPHSCNLTITTHSFTHSVIRSTSFSFPRGRLLPIWIRSSDSRMCALWMRKYPDASAFIAATLISDSSSAPLRPTVRFASCFRSTSSASRVYASRPHATRTFIVFLRRIASRASQFGNDASPHTTSHAPLRISRSKRPARTSAGSSTFFRFVAAMIRTPSSPRKPPISFSSWLIV